MVPDELRYTAEHEWVASAEGGAVRVGITAFAQDALGDIVYVDMKEPGTEVAVGDPLGEVESTKSVSEIYAPLAGTVVNRNEQLADQPELINTDPYGEGWLVELDAGTVDLDSLMSAESYRELTKG
ncbi:glycine cleavage system H protein [Pilimelia terevasa]|uniref:Glycine cleavage system H protein n=1 Tax=Pilimelia terevasa TaxID=53372 RepID=A0A8J3BUK1_9ACTN|nr:glycine cleavage system protein GcvH [Pilimelia terevasa]GGK37245.1 glycine cleavage system H protein [Pilimelia terevasa]